MLTMEQRYDADHDRNVYVLEIRFDGFMERRFLTDCDYVPDVEKLQPVEGGYKLEVTI